NGYSVPKVGQIIDFTSKETSTLSSIEPILNLQVADYNYSEYGYEVGTFKNVTSYVIVGQDYGGIGQTPKAIRLNNNVLQVADYNYGEYGNTVGTFKNVTSYVMVSQNYGGIGQTPKVIRLNNNVLQVADYNYGEYGITVGTFKNVTSYVIVSQNYGGIGQTPKVIRLIASCPADTEMNNGKCVPKSCDYPASERASNTNIGTITCPDSSDNVPMICANGDIMINGKKNTCSPLGSLSIISCMGITTGTNVCNKQCFKKEYYCPNGGVLSGTTCKKSCGSVTKCPEGYVETTGAEVAKGECKGNIDYSYYEYKCNEEKNGQNNNYQIINNGGDCNKSDTNNKTVNPELSNSCNSSTPPVNNCKRQSFKCNSNEIKPVYVNGEWQCSPFLCDSNMKCGYATCNSPSIPSTSKFQDVAYNPLDYIYNNKCNQDICDYVLNAQVSYCESSQCPKRDDVIEKNGLCYKMECPAGTYLSGDKCIKENF
ncbi:hypothetical protein ACOL3H_11970, partial [Aliarcobacter butzleri]